MSTVLFTENDIQILNANPNVLRASEQIIMRQEAKIKLLESQVELLKKADKIERRLVNQNIGLLASEIFKLIKNTVQNHGLQGMVSYFCTLLSVSRSGYYNYLNNSETREIKESEDLKAKNLILSAMNKHGYKKGARSILMTLRNEFGITMNRKKIQRIMRKYQIICPIRKADANGD